MVMYSRVRLVGRLSNRKMLPKVGLTGEFFSRDVQTGQLANLGRLTVILMQN